MKKEISITIIDIRTTWAKWLRNIIATFVLIVAPISIGIVAGSKAMQWVGFIFVVLSVFSIARSSFGLERDLSIAEARALLDRLEAGDEA